jgi:hypothetical protein
MLAATDICRTPQEEGEEQAYHASMIAVRPHLVTSINRRERGPPFKRASRDSSRRFVAGDVDSMRKCLGDVLGV